MLQHNKQRIGCICLLLFSGLSFAKNWNFQPQVLLKESYYDNITLQSENSGLKNKELVSQVVTGFSLSHQGRRLQLGSSYNLGYTKYNSQQFPDNTYNQASANLIFLAIKRHLTISSNASISQQVVDPAKAASSNSVFVSSNKVETRTLSFQPRLVNRFGDLADSDFKYSRVIINYSNDTLQSAWRNIYEYRLSSGSWFNRVTWYSTANVTDTNEINTGRKSALFRADYLISRYFSIFALGQVQKNNFTLSTSGSDSYFVNTEAGVVWTVSRKLRFEVGGGAVLDEDELLNRKLTIEKKTWRASINLAPSRRTNFLLGREVASFGERNYLNFQHRSRKTVWSSTFSESLISPQQLRLLSGSSSFSSGSSSVPSIGGSNFNSSSELGREITDDIIKRQRLDASLKIVYRKVSVKGGLFFDKGIYLTSLQRDKRYGANGSLNFLFGRLVTFSCSASAQRYYFNNNSQRDSIYVANASLLKNLGKQLTANFQYEWIKRNSIGSNFSYSAQQVIAGLKMTF